MRQPFRRLAGTYILGFLVNTGCAQIHSSAPLPPGTAVPIDTVLSVYRGSPYNERFRGLITSPAAWSALWTYVAGNYPLERSMPLIDFDQFQLLVVAAGSPGHASTDVSVRDSASARHVYVRITVGGSNCIETTDIQRPVHVVRIPRSSAPLIYHDTTVVDDCPPFKAPGPSSSN